MICGYRRVSSTDQNLDRQDLGTDVDRVFDDHLSGKNRDRPGLDAALSFVREGDTLRCHSVDRLGRSLKDLLNIVEELTGRGVVVEFVKENLTFDPTSDDPYARMQLQLLATFAEFERSIIRSRQREGIALAVQRGGVYRGRSAALRPEEVVVARQRHRDGVSVARLTKDYGVSPSTMQKALSGVGVYGRGDFVA